jgi:hypothetical protein
VIGRLLLIDGLLLTGAGASQGDAGENDESQCADLELHDGLLS